ncbi:MAG: AzlC family ABC transporter permease [Butyrivibrio sp.]|nr:AzlC family ABC transporter permease [Muribaculum sp.]MCM1551660.1 AzlC family ABC transporter permease [Butyrivibrio sp.]
MDVKLRKTAFVKTLPVMAGYIVLGMGFGFLLRANGYGVWWAFAMSVFIYAGSMQYVGVSLLAGGASFISIALTTLMINARHLFYGISMIKRYEGTGFRKIYLMHALTDETYSLVCTDDVPEGANPHQYYLLISFFDHIYWITGSVLGSLLGAALTFDTTGIDFVMTALFVTIFIEQWVSTKEHRPALIGVGASVLCLVIFGSGSFLIPSMVIILAALLMLRGKLEKKEEK